MKILLDSLDDPRLADYRSLKTKNVAHQSPRFVAEGGFVVERLLASDLSIHSLVVVDSLWESFAPMIPEELPALVLPKSLVSQLVGFSFHQGILASAERPPRPSLEELLSQAPSKMTMVACSRVVDPVNLASIIRLCTAFGVSGLLLESGCADPFSRRVVRVSMGNVFRLPIIERPDLKSELDRLRLPFDLSIMATVLSESATPLDQLTPASRTVLVLGNEGQGLSREWIELCDRQITIPMRGGTDSLNVAVAAGIFLYHFDPQR